MRSHCDWLPELKDLLDRLQDGEFTESDRLRLNGLLRAGAEQRSYFITYLDVHSRLAWEGGQESGQWAVNTADQQFDKQQSTLNNPSHYCRSASNGPPLATDRPFFRRQLRLLLRCGGHDRGRRAAGRRSMESVSTFKNLPTAPPGKSPRPACRRSRWSAG